MSYARQLLDTYPGTLSADAGMLAAIIDALNDCAQACTADADADLREQDLAEMVKCIRLCLDCADVCTATVGVVAARRTTTLVSPCRCWRPARPPARAAAMSASGMPSTMSTAGSASRPADVASRPAENSWAS
jgi:ferredoxin